LKKYIIIISVLSLLNGMSLASEGIDSRVINPENVIFRGAVNENIQDESDSENSAATENTFGNGYEIVDPYKMPVFQQMRLKLSNSLYRRKIKPKDHSKRDAMVSKLKFWDKNQEPQTVEENEKDEIAKEIAQQTSASLSGDELSLEGGINKEVTEKQLVLDSAQVSFDDETGDMIATGRPKLVIPPQNTTVIADKMTYNEESNILKAYGDVIIIKDGLPTKSDYFEVDMNEETMLLDKMNTAMEDMYTKAENAVQKEGLLILKNGLIHSDKDSISRIESSVAGPRFKDLIVDKNAQELFFGKPEGNNMNIKVEEIEVDARKDHDIIKIKNAKFYHKDKYLFRIKHLKAYMDKERTYFEANYPELGSRPKLGMFIGPGITFGSPFGGVMKAVPLLDYNHGKFGLGGYLKYTNTHNRTEIGYVSANSIFFARGKQRLDNNLYLTYAANSYTDEWFLGGRMAKYMAELYYDRAYPHKNFLGKNMDMTFQHRIGFGFMREDDIDSSGKKFPNPSKMSTTRTRYMAQIAQTLYKYENKEERIRANLSLAMQGSVALYGTGDTQFIGRIGPTLTTQYKNWMQNLAYYATAYQDQTPMPRYDAYRYGKHSVYLSEAFRINKYLSAGWSGYVNLSNDAPNKKMFQENAFLVAIGPDDFKVILGYDFIREVTYLGVNIAFNSRGTNIYYDKMTIKNPEKMGQHENKKEAEIAFIGPNKETYQEKSLFNKTPAKPQVLQYAQVIEIEDPDKETIE